MFVEVRLDCEWALVDEIGYQQSIAWEMLHRSEGCTEKARCLRAVSSFRHPTLPSTSLSCLDGLTAIHTDS